MTTTEFKDEFNISWDNINSGTAPGLDDYEISVFLTQGEEEIVKEYAKIFETSEKAREALKPVVRDLEIEYTSGDVTEMANKGIDSNSVFFKQLPTVWLIVGEQIIDPSGNRVKVIPITHDNYSTIKRNPFRSPSIENGFWKMDVSGDGATTYSYVEIILADKTGITTTTKYKCRYIKELSPIIVGAITPLTINGSSTEATSNLSTLVHREVLDRAIELATKAYKENTLQNQIMLNQRGNQ